MAKRLLVAVLVVSVMLAGCGPTLNTQSPGAVPPTQGPTCPDPTVAATRRGKIIVIALPDFSDAIAFKLKAKP